MEFPQRIAVALPSKMPQWWWKSVWKKIEKKENRLDFEGQLQAKNLWTNYRDWLQYNPKKMQISQ